VSDHRQWFDHQIADLSPEQRAVLEQSLRAEGIPATFGPAAVRTDVAYEARVSTLIDSARATAGSVQGAPPPYPATGAAYAPTAYPAVYPTAPSTNSNAIVALILGIGSLAVCSLAGPIAIVVGQKARREIRQTGEQGDGMALAGVITGAIASVLLALAILAIIVVVVIAAASSS
jgi:hypothetical protein